MNEEKLSIKRADIRIFVEKPPEDEYETKNRHNIGIFVIKKEFLILFLIFFWPTIKLKKTTKHNQNDAFKHL